jgi:hypothetical protein
MRRTAALFLGLLFLAPLLVATGCDGCQSIFYKSAIEKALHEDALTGHEPTFDHTAAMRKVDLSDCPEDFRVAYTNHIHAWDEAAKVNQAKAELTSDEDAAAAAGALATLFGSDETPWSDHERAVAEVNRLQQVASDDIHGTWQVVEDVSAKYNAQVPQ